ncbi:MAG: ATP-binding protein [Christensenellaceae bacterium]|nr:ATP-binding protein [Christensenellaceae bacterium]
MTISQIFDEYARKRSAAEARAAAEHERIREILPELAVLEDERRLLYADLIGAALMNPSARKKIEAEIHGYDEKISALLLRNGIQSLEPDYECSLCQDSGYIEENGEKAFCPCLLERIYVEVFGAKPIGSLKGSFGKFDELLFSEKNELLGGSETNPRKQINNAKSYVERYSEAYPQFKRNNTVLIGKAGLGKTFLMECMARRLYLKTRKILFISAFALFGVFHKHRLGEMDDLDLIYDADIIFLDDLGSEPVTQNVTREYFLQLLEKRTAARKPLIVATNLSENDIRNRYGERAASRLFANDDTARFFLIGQDLRLS